MKQKTKNIIAGILIIGILIGLSFPFVLADQSCSDSDGTNFENKGFVTTVYNGASLITYDKCHSSLANTLVEYICYNNWIASSNIDCETYYGIEWTCNDGKCTNQQCTAGSFCPSGKNCFNSYYYCGTLENNVYYKQYKNSDCSISTYQYTCSSGQTCKESIGCEKVQSCTDSDGLNYKNKGQVTSIINGNTQIYIDKCSTLGLLDTVVEYSCNGDIQQVSNINCKDIFGSEWTCDDGKCSVGIAECPKGEDICPSDRNCNEYSIPYFGKHQYYCGTIDQKIIFYAILTGEKLSNGNCNYGSTQAKVCDTNCSNGKCISNCTLDSPEECGDGIINICDKEECEICGWYFTPNNILPGGKCTLEQPQGKCQSCDEFALSYLLGSIWKSKSCDSTGWSLQWSFFFIKPPQGTITCLLSLIKLILVPIVLIFGFLFTNEFFNDRVKSLKGKKKNVIRIILSGIIAILLSILVYVVFIVGLVLFIIIIIIKSVIKSLL